MRLKITNASKAPDSFVLPLIRFAAKFFNVSGRVTVEFRETKRTTQVWKRDPREVADGKPRELIPAEWTQKLYSGYCYTGARQISVCSTLNPAHPRLPLKSETLAYFSGSKIPITPHELRTPEEIIVHVAAHEFGHCMKRGQKFRKSRIEVFCENKATEVLEAFRTPEGQAWIAAERARMTASNAEPEPADVDLAAEKRAKAEAKLANINARLKRWHSKAKRAATAIRKLTRAAKRLQGQIGGLK